MKLAVLYLQYDTVKYYRAFDDMMRFLEKVSFDKQIVVIDNKASDLGYESERQLNTNTVLISGDNTNWEFSGWDKGVQYLKDKGIEYDAILFINDSFMNNSDGGTPETIINDRQIVKCVKENIAVQAIVQFNLPIFKLDGKSCGIRGRSHLFLLPKTIVEKLGSLVTYDDNFMEKCIVKGLSKYKADAPMSESLKEFLLHFLGGFWHSAFIIEKNPDLFWHKTKAVFNEMMLHERLLALENDYEFQIDNADVVVFDVFDTAIFRKVNSPGRIHYLMGRDFWHARKNAETLAFEYNKNCNLEDIYNVKNLTLKKMQNFEDIYNAGNLSLKKMQQEIELEFALCYQNPEIFQKYEYAKNKGKEIIFFSDMYLPSIVIKRMLQKCGYSKHTVFVSNEINVRKDTAEAYIFLKSRYSDTSKVLMIGDNVHSDYNVPKAYGFKAIHYQKTKNAEDFWYRVGYERVGCIALAYVRWLQESFRQKGIEKAYFFAREGDLFSKIYAEIREEGDPDFQLLYLSRKALVLPQLTNLEVEELLNKSYYANLKIYLKYYTCPNAKNYCECLDVDYERVRTKLKDENYSHLDVFARGDLQENILRKIYPELQEVAAQKLIGAREYFRKNLDFVKKKIALVDLGWGGSIHESFIRFVSEHFVDDIEPECYLLSVLKPVKAREERYSYNYFLDIDNSIFTKNIHLIECLFNAPYGQCEGYTEDGEPIFGDEDCSYCEHIHRGALDFVKDSKLMSINDYKRLGLVNLSHLFDGPSPEEAEYIGNIEFFPYGAKALPDYIAKPDLNFLAEQKDKAWSGNMFEVRANQMLSEWRGK